MLIVKIELWPYGREDCAHELGRLTIGNDGTGNSIEGNYDVSVSLAGGEFKTGRVERWPRQIRPVWDLVVVALRTLGVNP